jgi:hypothetical protein
MTIEMISLTLKTFNQENNIQNSEIQTDSVNNLNKNFNLNLNQVITSTPSNLLGLSFLLPNRCKFKRL